MKVKALLLLLCLALLAGLSCRQRTEEDIVLDVVDSLTRLAEKRDLEGIMAFFAADFRDFEGRSKEGLRALLSNYFTGRAGLVLHTLSKRMIGLEDGQAELEADVALSSGGAVALRRLVRVSPDITRLRIGFIKVGDEWRISYAEWSPISLTELLPESVIALKKLFPKI